MKKKLILIIAFAVVLISVGAVLAQDPPPADGPDRPQGDGPDGKGRLMRELGLSRDQIRQLRMLNARRRPLMQEAQRKQRQAMDELDEAIYADAVDDAAFQLKLKNLQLAQAEVAKIRAINELEVRKILTPEQLAKFRELRRRMDALRDRGRPGMQRPGQRMPRGAPPDSPADEPPF